MPPLELPPYHAQLHVQKVVEALKVSEGLIYLEGDVMKHRHDTDVELPFRQESNFFYMTGCDRPGFIFIHDIATKKSILFAPVPHADDLIWSGPPPSLSDLQTQYSVSQVLYQDALLSTIEQLNPPVIHVMQCQELQKLGALHSYCNDKCLKEAIWTARMTKTPSELSILRTVVKASAEAHTAIMKSVKPGTNESDLECRFRYETLIRGCKSQAYMPIVGYSHNASILHYNANNAPMNDPNGLVLVDAGAELSCYASDITRTYPVGGKFTTEARQIYEIVLEANKKVIEGIRIGVEWESLHRLAERIICDGLMKLGIIQGTVEELLANHIPAVFFPHGLGHLLGLDVHDPFGYPPNVPRINEPGIKYLRLRRKLEKGMVVTVEPGIYFVEQLIKDVTSDPAKSRYLNSSVLTKYFPVGGVRIEDDVLVTEHGAEVLSKDAIKEVADIEKVMKRE